MSAPGSDAKRSVGVTHSNVMSDDIADGLHAIAKSINRLADELTAISYALANPRKRE